MLRLPLRRCSILLASLALAAAACSPTSVILREESGRARWQVTSEPSGAVVTAAGVRRGQTPLQLQVPLKRVERLRRSREWKVGWWLFATGLLAAGAAAGLTAWGASNIGGGRYGETEVGPIMALSFGPLTGLYGSVALAAGIYSLIVYRPRRSTDLEPSVLPLQLEQPGAPAAQAQLVLDPNALEARGRIHFASASLGWSSKLSRGVRLHVLSTPVWPTTERASSSVTAASRAAVSPVPAPAAATPAPAPAPAADLTLLQELRQQGEACYRRREYRCAVAKFERALGLAPSPAMRFNLASAQDKLGLAVLAVRQYRRYLEEAGRTAVPTALAHIQRRMKQLIPRIGRLQLTRPGGDFRISIDGIALDALDPATLGGGRVEVVLEPGSYRVDVSVAGRAARSQRVELRAGVLQTLELRP